MITRRYSSSLCALQCRAVGVSLKDFMKICSEEEGRLIDLVSSRPKSNQVGLSPISNEYIFILYIIECGKYGCFVNIGIVQTLFLWVILGRLGDYFQFFYGCKFLNSD